jgi:isocitrate lyase
MKEAAGGRNVQMDRAGLAANWRANPRWRGIARPYTPAAVLRLRGSVQVEHTFARMGADRLWDLVHDEPNVGALGALTSNQAIQQVKVGLKAIYVSGWQVATDANLSGQRTPNVSAPERRAAGLALLSKDHLALAVATLSSRLPARV